MTFLAGVGSCILAEVALLAFIAARCLPNGGWRFK